MPFTITRRHKPIGWIGRVFPICMEHKMIESTMRLLLVCEVESAIASNNRLTSTSFMVNFRDNFVDHAVESR